MPVLPPTIKTEADFKRVFAGATVYQTKEHAKLYDADKEREHGADSQLETYYDHPQAGANEICLTTEQREDFEREMDVTIGADVLRPFMFQALLNWLQQNRLLVDEPEPPKFEVSPLIKERVEWGMLVEREGYSSLVYTLANNPNIELWITPPTATDRAVVNDPAISYYITNHTAQLQFSSVVLQETIEKIQELFFAEYVERGGVACPWCKSDAIEGFDVDNHDTGRDTNIKCNGCGRQWTELYRLVNCVIDEPAAQIDYVRTPNLNA